MTHNRRSAPVRLVELGLDYTRYSTEDQGSTVEQRAINEELAAENGIDLVAHFSDEGVSRSLSDRPGLGNAFAYLESHPEVGFIVVNELERLTAGVDQRQQITRLCKQHRITIITEDMGRIDPHDEDKMQEADQRAVTAKGEVLKVRRRTRRTLRAKVKAGDTVVMRPPYGVRMKPLVMPDGTELPSGVSMLDGRGKKMTSGEIEAHPDEYPWLLQIFNWAAGGVSLNEICRRLMKEQVPTKTGRTRWDSTTVRGILDNPIYKGEMTWGARRTLRDEDGRVYYELRDEGDPGTVTLPSPAGALVDPAIWDQVQERKRAARGTRLATRRSLEPQVLDHRVFCGRCGHKMYGRADATKTGHSWRYLCLSSYGSTSYAPVEGFGKPCTTGHSISLNDLLAALAGQSGYGGKTMSATVVRGALPVGNAEERRKHLEAEKVAAQKQYDKALELATLDLMSVDELRGAKAVRDQRVATAQTALGAIVEDAPVEEAPFAGEYLDQMTALVAGLVDESQPVAVRQELIAFAGLDRIYVDKPRLRLHFR